MDLKELSQLGVGVAALLLLWYVIKLGYEERKENNRTLAGAFDATSKSIAANKNKDKALTDLVKTVQELAAGEIKTQTELKELTLIVQKCVSQVKPSNKLKSD